MAILSQIDFSGGLNDLYRKGIGHAKQYTSGTALDHIEWIASLSIPSALGLIASLSFLSNGFAIAACAAGCGILGSYMHHRYLKIPSIDLDITDVVAKSKGSNSALFVHTTKDHNGAFSSLHSVTQIYQDCARTHTIDRIRGFSYKERFKVQGKKYDVAVLMAHGSPQSMEMDGDFLENRGLSRKKLSFLYCRVKEGGKIILNSCSTGKGDENLAKVVSEAVPHATVYASSELVYPVGVEFDEDMIPTFNDGQYCKGRNSTRIYQNGKLI